MNILEIFGEAPEVPDMLVAVFERQQELMEKYDPIERKNGHFVPLPPFDINDRHWQLRIKELTYRIVEELSEASNTLKNKPWKQTPVITDETHFLEEMSDAFHFFIELCIVVGMGPKELYTLYHKKNIVNQFRQRSKY